MVHSLSSGVMVRLGILQSECDGSLVIKWRDGSPRFFFYNLSVMVHLLSSGVMVRPVILQSECDGSLVITWCDSSPSYFTI